MAERTPNQRMSERDKFSIVAFANLYRNPESNKFYHGYEKFVKEHFNIDRKTLLKIIKQYDKKCADGEIFIDLSLKDRSNCGPDSKLTDTIRMNLIDLHNLTKSECSYPVLAENYLNEFGAYLSTSSIRRYYLQLGMSIHQTFTQSNS